MQEKDKLLTTRILDHHGKIGPFFFKEFLFVFLVCVSLFFMVLLLSLFIEMNSSLLLVVPSAFLLFVGIIRFLIILKVTSPWYLHKWVANQWLKPKHSRADMLKTKKIPTSTPNP
jgi:hypothetical protein